MITHSPPPLSFSVFYVAEQAMTALTGGGHSHSHHDAHGGAGDGHASGGHRHIIPCQGGKKQVGECANKHQACCQAAPANVQRRSMKEWLANAGQTIVEDICGRCRALKTMAQKGAKPAAYLNLLADIMHNFTGAHHQYLSPPKLTWRSDGIRFRSGGPFWSCHPCIPTPRKHCVFCMQPVRLHFALVPPPSDCTTASSQSISGSADGLALGVSFGKGHGLSTTLAVFFHEVGKPLPAS